MKMNLEKTLFLVIIIVITYLQANADRIKDKMYEPVTGSKACFRRMNATNQVGCSSKRGGSSGVIHYCETQNDIDFVLKNGTAGPYVPVIPTKLFTVDNVRRFKNSEKIAGLLIYVVELSDNEHFTHEQQCPNRQFNVKGTCSSDNAPIWNPYGTGLLYEDIPFPIFYVEDKANVKFTKDCFEKFNNFSYDRQRDRSLCSLQLSSFMYGTTDTPTCIRRSNSVTNLNPTRFCDPLADQNVWATLYPPTKKYKYIVISARIDATTMFDKTAGAISPITGLVALMSTAKLLKTMFPDNKNQPETNVLFLILNGETYDYIGSQRLLYDITNGNFPNEKSKDTSTQLHNIQLNDIILFVEFSQLGNVNGTVVAHYLGTKTGTVPHFYQILQANKENVDLDESQGTLPPASLHTFIRKQQDFPGLVLTDHKSQYYNRFYNSIYDNVSNIDYQYYNLSSGDNSAQIPNHSIQKLIANVSAMVAKSVYFQITGEKYLKEDVADLQLIDELFHCYLENATCRVYQAVKKLKLQDTPLSLYVGVELVLNFVTNLAGMTMAWVTGTVVGPSDINCTNQGNQGTGWRYFNMSSSLDDLNSTKCYKSSMNFTEALSPAFVIKDYDWSSGLYSSWTESTWGDFKIRIFLKPSAAHENMTIAIGSIVLVFSFIFVYFVKSRSDILFPPPLPTLAPTSC